MILKLMSCRDHALGASEADILYAANIEIAHSLLAYCLVKPYSRLIEPILKHAQRPVETDVLNEHGLKPSKLVDAADTTLRITTVNWLLILS